MAASLATAPRPHTIGLHARQHLRAAAALDQTLCHLASVAAHVTWHMALKASSVSVLLPHPSQMAPTTGYGSGAAPSRVVRSATRKSSGPRFAPYQQHPRATSTFDKISPPHSPNHFGCGPPPPSAFPHIPNAATLAAVGVLQSPTSYQIYRPSPVNNHSSIDVAIQLQKIQTIAYTALSAFNLPTHTIILALYFVHRLLMASLGSSAKRHNFSGLDSSFDKGESVVFSANPLYLFLAGLILADAVLCDAPVSVASWTWVLKQAELGAFGKPGLDSSFVCKLKAWALNVLCFDVHVDVSVYSEWVESVKGLLDKWGQTQRRMFEQYLQAFSLSQFSRSMVIL
ncbi:hypothetical protein HDU84_006580 [Entophlyctis sp. JEL0112]|nr:hypothetical protein HDU84_006580 [Entophlyctis sp. JEL0112]